MNDYAHLNSVTVSRADPRVLILSARHLSCVTALARDGSGVLWHLSTEVASERAAVIRGVRGPVPLGWFRWLCSVGLVPLGWFLWLGFVGLVL